MNWKKLEQIEQLVDIDVQSHAAPVIIFKHSTRCSISAAALDRMERNWNSEEMKDITPYFMDLLANRTTSNAVADHYEITHESPQLLLIKKGECVYHSSHMEIDYNDLKQQALK